MCDECPGGAKCPLSEIVENIVKIKAEIEEEYCLFEKAVCEIAVRNAGKMSKSMDDMLKNASDHLAHRKLLGRNSARDAILSSIMATLYARSQETEEHGARLKHITRVIGEKLELKQEVLDNLELLSMLHDIGKIGIDDRVLNKPGKLSADEWELMKRHAEIGCRIAKSSPEFEHIADLILYHHERWDGTGYPKALKGTEIPLESRIMAIADAYDAMTHKRVYHESIPLEAAMDEIRRCAGTQFDPDIALLFIELQPSIESMEAQISTGLTCF